MSFYPNLRSCFTDWGAFILNAQSDDHHLCKDMELRAMDCLEAYGMDKGQEKCKDILEDLAECVMKWKQMHRVEMMRRERLKEYWSGERTKENLYAKPPPLDS